MTELVGPSDFAPLDVDASRVAVDSWPRLAETQRSHGRAREIHRFFGAADETVRQRNSKALAAKLGAGGVHVEQLGYSSLGHVDLTRTALSTMH